MYNENLAKSVFFFFSKLEIFPQIEPCHDGEGERKAACQQRPPDLAVCLEVNIKPLVFLYDVPGLPGLAPDWSTLIGRGQSRLCSDWLVFSYAIKTELNECVFLT